MQRRATSALLVIAASLAVVSPALANERTPAGLFDYVEVPEDKDTPSAFDAMSAEVGDNHPLVKRAQDENPGKAIVVCMAGCDKGSGSAVYAEPAKGSSVTPQAGEPHTSPRKNAAGARLKPQSALRIAPHVALPPARITTGSFAN